MESKNEQTGQTQDEICQISDTDKWHWYQATYNLIEHENKMVGDRLGWTGTFQGFLFAALSFSWNDDKGVVVLVLCAIGSGISIISLVALLQASSAIYWVTTDWDNRVIIDKTLKKLPCIWAWKKPPWFKGTKGEKYGAWLRSPWNYIPLILLVGWAFLGLFHLFTRVDQNINLIKPLSEELQLRLYDNLQKALVYKESDVKALDKISYKKQEVIAGIALIHGDIDKGKEVFDHYCVDCHDSKEPFPSNIGPSRYMLRSGEFNRKEIISGILYPKPHMYDFVTLLPNRDLINVIEYLAVNSKEITK